MTSHRFIIDTIPEDTGMVMLEGAEHHHLFKVARIRPGDSVELFDNEGTSYLARVEAQDRSRTRLSIQKRRKNSPAALRIVLAQSLLKSKAQEWIIQKATELGIAVFVPLQTERTIVKIPQHLEEKKRERWSRIAREAAKQSGRNDIPEIAPLAALPEFLGRAAADRKLFLNEKEGTRLKEIVLSPSWRDKNERPGACEIILMIGPEGGWTNQESMAIVERGFEAVHLGDNTLRAETAAISAIAVISQFWMP